MPGMNGGGGGSNIDFAGATGLTTPDAINEYRAKSQAHIDSIRAVDSDMADNLQGYVNNRDPVSGGFFSGLWNALTPDFGGSLLADVGAVASAPIKTVGHIATGGHSELITENLHHLGKPLAAIAEPLVNERARGDKDVDHWTKDVWQGLTGQEKTTGADMVASWWAMGEAGILSPLTGDSYDYKTNSRKEQRELFEQRRGHVLSQVAGFGIDVAVDPLTYFVPGGKFGKSTAEVAGLAASITEKGTASSLIKGTINIGKGAREVGTVAGRKTAGRVAALKEAAALKSSLGEKTGNVAVNMSRAVDPVRRAKIERLRQVEAALSEPEFVATVGDAAKRNLEAAGASVEAVEGYAAKAAQTTHKGVIRSMDDIIREKAKWAGKKVGDLASEFGSIHNIPDKEVVYDLFGDAWTGAQLKSSLRQAAKHNPLKRNPEKWLVEMASGKTGTTLSRQANAAVGGARFQISAPWVVRKWAERTAHPFLQYRYTFPLWEYGSSTIARGPGRFFRGNSMLHRLEKVAMDPKSPFNSEAVAVFTTGNAEGGRSLINKSSGWAALRDHAAQAGNLDEFNKLFGNKGVSMMLRGSERVGHFTESMSAGAMLWRRYGLTGVHLNDVRRNAKTAKSNIVENLTEHKGTWVEAALKSQKDPSRARIMQDAVKYLEGDDRMLSYLPSYLHDPVRQMRQKMLDGPELVKSHGADMGDFRMTLAAKKAGDVRTVIKQRLRNLDNEERYLTPFATGKQPLNSTIAWKTPEEVQVRIAGIQKKRQELDSNLEEATKEAATPEGQAKLAKGQEEVTARMKKYDEMYESAGGRRTGGAKVPSHYFHLRFKKEFKEAFMGRFDVNDPATSGRFAARKLTASEKERTLVMGLQEAEDVILKDPEFAEAAARVGGKGNIFEDDIFDVFLSWANDMGEAALKGELTKGANSVIANAGAVDNGLFHRLQPEDLMARVEQLDGRIAQGKEQLSNLSASLNKLTASRDKQRQVVKDSVKGHRPGPPKAPSPPKSSVLKRILSPGPGHDMTHGSEALGGLLSWLRHGDDSGKDLFESELGRTVGTADLKGSGVKGVGAEEAVRHAHGEIGLQRYNKAIKDGDFATSEELLGTAKQGRMGADEAIMGNEEELRKAMDEVQATSQAGLKARGAPAEMIVFRGGAPVHGVVPMTTDPAVAATFKSYGPVKAYKIKRSDVLVDYESTLPEGHMFKGQGELLVDKKALRAIDEVPEEDVLRLAGGRTAGNSLDKTPATDKFYEMKSGKVVPKKKPPAERAQGSVIEQRKLSQIEEELAREERRASHLLKELKKDPAVQLEMLYDDVAEWLPKIGRELDPRTQEKLENVTRGLNDMRAAQLNLKASPEAALKSWAEVDPRLFSKVDLPGFKDVAMPKYMAAELHRAMNGMPHGGTAGDFRDIWAKYVNGPWKKQATIYWWGFHARNNYGALFNNLMGRGMDVVDDMNIAWKVRKYSAANRGVTGRHTWKQGFDDVSKPGAAARKAEADKLGRQVIWRNTRINGVVRKEVTVKDLHDMAAHQGVLGHSSYDLADLYKSRPNQYQKLGRTHRPITGHLGAKERYNVGAGLDVLENAGMRAAVETENFHRMTAMIGGLIESGGDANAARMYTMMRHGDYEDLTEWEENVKAFIPFFKWMRTNTPFQVRNLLERPGQTALPYEKLRNSLLGKDEREGMKDYTQNEFLIKVPGLSNLPGQKGEAAGWHLVIDLPMDALHMDGREFMSSVLPIVQPIYENAISKTDTFTGAPLTGRTEKLPDWVHATHLDDVLEGLPGFERQADGVLTTNDYMLNMVKTIPLFSRVSTFFSGENERKEMRLAALLSMTAGIGSRRTAFEDLEEEEMRVFYEVIEPQYQHLEDLGYFDIKAKKQTQKITGGGMN